MAYLVYGAGMRVSSTDYDFNPETPLLGSVRKLNGEPGSVLNGYDYPVTATCVAHGRKMRCDTYFGDWYHVDDDPGTVRDIAAGMDLRSPRKQVTT